MALLTTQGIVTRFQSLFRETSTRWFTTQWQVDSVNNAVSDLRSEIDAVAPEYLGVATTTISYVNQQQEYNLPANFSQAILVEVTDLGGPPYPTLGRIDVYNRDIDSPIGPTSPALIGGGVGEPTVYYVDQSEPSTTPTTIGNLVIGFVPIPGRTATGNVKVTYHTAPYDISTIDTSTYPDLPSDWHDLIPLHMCVLAAIADNNPSAQAWASLYNDRLTRRLGQALSNRMDDPSEVLPVRDY